MPEYEIVRDDDPRCAELEAAGYEIVGESWAARLYEPDCGYTVTERWRSYAPRG